MLHSIELMSQGKRPLWKLACVHGSQSAKLDDDGTKILNEDGGMMTWHQKIEMEWDHATWWILWSSLCCQMKDAWELPWWHSDLADMAISGCRCGNDSNMVMMWWWWGRCWCGCQVGSLRASRELPCGGNERVLEDDDIVGVSKGWCSRGQPIRGCHVVT